jgi:TolA-binding protein
LRKLMMLAAMLAVALVAAAPAIAQVSQEFSESRDKSGTASPKTEISNTGDQANLCAAILQAANTGNVLNEQGVLQYNQYRSDDIEFEGSDITITPELTQTCEQTIRQVTEAGKGEAKAGEAEAKAGGAEAQAGGGGGKELPRTGGVAPLLGLGAGALLVAGGLLARKIFR